jgi:hypothetical protein
MKLQKKGIVNLYFLHNPIILSFTAHKNQYLTERNQIAGTGLKPLETLPKSRHRLKTLGNAPQKPAQA